MGRGFAWLGQFILFLGEPMQKDVRKTIALWVIICFVAFEFAYAMVPTSFAIAQANAGTSHNTSWVKQAHIYLTKPPSST